MSLKHKSEGAEVLVKGELYTRCLVVRASAAFSSFSLNQVALEIRGKLPEIVPQP
jgi:hypothetical protein